MQVVESRMAAIVEIAIRFRSVLVVMSNSLNLVDAPELIPGDA